MKRHLSRGLRSVVLLAGVLMVAGGCSVDTPMGPDPATEAPALPSAERLAFDFSLFAEEPSEETRASKANFFNAYIRAVVAQAVTHFVLTPPVYAFSLAIHTVPSPQDDGSYVWVYTIVDGEAEAQIRLTGRPISGDRVEWALRVTNPYDVPALDNALWFEGETWKDGEHGFFRFHEPAGDAEPVVARLDWGADADGEFLRLTDLNENVDDSLEYRVRGRLGQITWTDASAPDQSWFVKWNDADGTGSLRAPDYNGGEEACWDERQNDTECAVPAS